MPMTPQVTSIPERNSSTRGTLSRRQGWSWPPGEGARPRASDAAYLQDLPADVCVHPDRGGENAGAGIGDAEEFEHSLHAAVLTVLAVEAETDHVHPILQGFVGDRFGLLFQVVFDVARAVGHQQL